MINSPSAHVLPVSIIAKLFRKRLVVFHQGDLILREGPVNRVIEKVFDASSYLSFALADNVATYTTDYAEHSRVLRPFLRKFQPVMMPFPVSAESEPDGSMTRSRVPADTKVLFGFAGRFVAEKGFDVLFDAIPQVMDAVPGAHFAFAGETNMAYEDFFGQTQDRLARVKDHVTILGLLDEEGMADFYRALDFIVMPSRSDCFPLVQGEAMKRGDPSIVSDIPGARVLVRETGYGFIVEKENPQALARGLIEAARADGSLADKYPAVLDFLDDVKNTERIARFISG
jgi:glycosyltransferase involved in cell wall biosynthesis